MIHAVVAAEVVVLPVAGVIAMVLARVHAKVAAFPNVRVAALEHVPVVAVITVVPTAVRTVLTVAPVPAVFQYVLLLVVRVAKVHALLVTALLHQRWKLVS